MNTETEMTVRFDDEDIRTAPILSFYDVSGSMRSHEELMYEASCNLLKTLGDRNETATDIRYTVQYHFFNDTLEVFNEELMPPEDMVDLISRKHFHTAKSTDLGSLYECLYNRFRTGSPFMQTVRHCGVRPTVLIVTDHEGNRNTELEREYIRKLKNNRLFRDYARCLCIYVGDATKKDTVTGIFGEENVVALSSDLSKHLSNTLINSTVNLIDGTDISRQEQSAREIAEQEKTRSESAAAALDTMSYEEAKKYMNELFNR